jgi:serine/threonine protein kinase
LHHPNVVRILAVCEAPPAVLMEYVDGGDLRAYLAQHHPSLRQRVLFALAGARGMAYLHDCQIFHCDLKCDNIFVQKVGLLVVCYFGMVLFSPGGSNCVTMQETLVAKIGDFGLVRHVGPRMGPYRLRGWWNHRISRASRRSS